MVGKENLTFLKIAISLKLEWRHPSKLVYMLNTLTSICMIFLSQFYRIKFFDEWTIVHGRKEKFDCF